MPTPAKFLPWPDSIIPYVPNPKHKFWSTIIAAIMEMNLKTNVQFIPRTNELNYIYFKYETDVCNQSECIGMKYSDDGSGQFVNINKNCRNLHELGHVLGLIHEHQRSDRDQYIHVIKDKMDESCFSQTQIQAICHNSDNQQLPYNIHSFMHYWCTSGAKTNGQQTIVYRPNPSMKFDTPEYLNDLSIEAINRIYPTPYQIELPANNCTYKLHSIQASGCLDAGPHHIRSDSYPLPDTNPYLYWQIEQVCSTSGWNVLWNVQTQSYLDGGPSHTRNYHHGEQETNHYLHWKIHVVVNGGKFLQLENRAKSMYLSCGKKHVKKFESNDDQQILWSFYRVCLDR
ncbi:unnamed protein product [Didymodactylos carnosus]|uniref:Metalloendopeptidase n=1 Tax=Didymodactylos carnosus TaxID=1234261 RepID=A0A814HTW1_9BILA|nr:unnamed protein product [Didymodactylos carnosus]CAF1014608.1 unnamed protein product [Didymodactylos carnosus]CAF3630412.1 unnamed protein product [Didymodactylos carnosus]CAF3786109.1 unnamed protein product [Didymodactylos carnosus]